MQGVVMHYFTTHQHRACTCTTTEKICGCASILVYDELTERGALGSRNKSCRSPHIAEQVPKSPNVVAALCVCDTQRTEHSTGSRRSYCCMHGTAVWLHVDICIVSAVRRNYRFSFGGPLSQLYAVHNCQVRVCMI